MKRAEFTKETKRQALQRSGGLCEAQGKVYSFSPGQRCLAPLSYGVEFDHYPIRAADGGSNELSNCVAVCRKCHRWKTVTFDVPAAAKEHRVQDKHLGIVGPADVFPTNRNRSHKRSIRGVTTRRLTRPEHQ